MLPAVARRFAGRGAQPACRSRAAAARGTAEELGARHLLLGGDPATSNEPQVTVAGAIASSDCRCRELRTRRFVSTIGGGAVITATAASRLGLRTAVVSCKVALPALIERGRGSIVNIGAGSAARAGAGMGAYAASKAGVQRLTESLAEELKDRGITVNAVLPSIIDTPRNRADMPDADFTRWVRPEAIAEVVAFLASDAARAVTGAAIAISGRV